MRELAARFKLVRIAGIAASSSATSLGALLKECSAAPSPRLLCLGFGFDSFEQHAGELLDRKCLCARRQHEFAQLLNALGFERPLLVGKRFQLRLEIANFAHRMLLLWYLERIHLVTVSIGANSARQSGTTPSRKSLKDLRARLYVVSTCTGEVL